MRRSDVPPDLAAIIARCLSKNREDRFPDAGALRAALASVRTQGPGWSPAMPIGDFGPRPSAPPPPPPPPPPPQPPADRDLTIAGPNSDLAGLTVRITDRSGLPDFGPTPTPYEGAAGFGYQPEEPPVVAVLPTVTQWQDPDPTTFITAPKPRGKGKRMLLIGLAAVVVGAAVGVLAPILLDRSDDRASEPPVTTTRQTTTTTTTPAPTTTTQDSPPPEAGGDPAFAPTLSPLDDQGGSIVLTWTDPTGGNAQFVVVDVTGEQKTALATVAGGETTYTVEDLDPNADQYCYQVIGIGLDDPSTQRGASATVCTAR
jgi:hypothetical protein